MNVETEESKIKYSEFMKMECNMFYSLGRCVGSSCNDCPFYFDYDSNKQIDY